MKKLINKAQKLCLLTVATLSQSAFAATTVSGSKQFSDLGAWFNDYIAFMQGPFAKAAVVASIILAVLAWNFLPKDGIMGGVLRTVISGIVVLNAATWVTSFEGSS